MSKDILGFEEKFLKGLRDFLKESSIEEIELENGEDIYLRISKISDEHLHSSTFPVYHYSPIQVHSSFEVESNIEKAEVKKEEKELKEANVDALYNDETKYYKVKSPLVGTFYEAPSPGSPPFVKLGDVVLPDTTLCIVEAMKVMNEIKAETKGKVVKILKKNAEPVAADEVMFIIEKA
jgi:acetyl-CoA carboxylase biotin carboxyl carrier protein